LSKDGEQLWNQFRGALISNGQTVEDFAESHRISRRVLRSAAFGERSGPKAQQWLEVIRSTIQEARGASSD